MSYSKGKLEEAFRAGGVLEKPPVKPHKDPALAALKKDDVELIVRVCSGMFRWARVDNNLTWLHDAQMSEFDLPKSKAEKVLLENGGDVKKALTFLIYGT